MADKLKQLSVAEQDAMIDRVVEKPRRERQRRLLKLGYEAPDVHDAVAVYQATLVEMDDVLATQPWLAGSDFSLADAATAPYLQTLEQFGWSVWYANVLSQPSYQSAVTADYSAGKLADLAARGAPAWLKIKARLAERGIAAERPNRRMSDFQSCEERCREQHD